MGGVHEINGEIKGKPPEQTAQVHTFARILILAKGSAEREKRFRSNESRTRAEMLMLREKMRNIKTKDFQLKFVCPRPCLSIFQNVESFVSRCKRDSRIASI